MTSFDVASRVTPAGELVFDMEVPERWQQGRGAFGGLVVGALLRAIEASDPEPGRRTRTVIAEIAAPVVVGKGTIEVTIVRRGSNQSNIRADLKQNGAIVAFASAVRSTPRPVGVPDRRPRVDPMPRIEDAIAIPKDAPMMPVFLTNFDLAVKTGVPWSGAKEPVVEAWVRLTDAPPVVDAPLLMAYLDSYWPACYPVLAAPRPTATLSFMAELLRDPSTIDPKAPLFYRAQTVCDDEGFQLEYRELFAPDGSLVAANQQTFVVIK